MHDPETERIVCAQFKKEAAPVLHGERQVDENNRRKARAADDQVTQAAFSAQAYSSVTAGHAHSRAAR